AEQPDPCRRVAIKVLHGAALSPALRTRFQREAEILGRLQHRYIAQIFEASVMDVGRGDRPYYAMEYIEGLTITRHADVHELSTRERLELLARVCEGVEYAHQKSVIHRDLKPDNILVNPQGDPKVLDFGVASIGQEAAVSVTTVTHTGQILGTFAYMAPEVLSATGNLNDPRIDVYALGVIGFELLCGRKPVELGNSSMAAASRALEMETTTRLGSVDRT
ncbi:MAG: serine/threonine protein kinase, partial [Planctomycetes bacterium]|nr:serine/threonine protein kinase [Planctomycetota bacterium]